MLIILYLKAGRLWQNNGCGPVDDGTYPAGAEVIVRCWTLRHWLHEVGPTWRASLLWSLFSRWEMKLFFSQCENVWLPLFCVISVELRILASLEPHLWYCISFLYSSSIFFFFFQKGDFSFQSLFGTIDRAQVPLVVPTPYFENPCHKGNCSVYLILVRNCCVPRVEEYWHLGGDSN